MTTQSRYLRIQNEADAMLELLREIVAGWDGHTDQDLAQDVEHSMVERELYTHIIAARAIIARIDGAAS